jgi:DNA (cytosine-5)-methyltransferase 1
MHPGTTLTDAMRQWPTPDARAAERINRSPSDGAAERPTLALASRLWPTPNTGESVSGHGRRGGSGMADRQSSRDLEVQARGWPTPAARDVKGANTNQTHATDQLANVTARWSGPPGPRTSSAGDLPSLSTPRLNPRFVEWLMGFPIGWTAFAASATEWSRWRLLMRSELSRLGWESPC